MGRTLLGVAVVVIVTLTSLRAAPQPGPPQPASHAGLTAVEGAAKEQGERAVADLFTLIRGGEIEPAEHHVRLVVRNSSGPVS